MFTICSFSVSLTSSSTVLSSPSPTSILIPLPAEPLLLIASYLRSQLFIIKVNLGKFAKILLLWCYFLAVNVHRDNLNFLKLNLKLTGSELQLEVKLGMLNIRKVEIIK